MVARTAIVFLAFSLGAGGCCATTGTRGDGGPDAQDAPLDDGASEAPGDRSDGVEDAVTEDAPGEDRPMDVPADDATTDVVAEDVRICPLCTIGRTCCSGTCVDLTSDPNNCGGCGLSCPPTVPTCSGGMCTAGTCTCLCLDEMSGTPVCPGSTFYQFCPSSGCFQTCRCAVDCTTNVCTTCPSPPCPI